jgi:cation diffusion facilitator CzcD-associated flavoprotein CzcO
MLELRSADRSKTIYRMFRKENNQCMGLAREYGGGVWRFDNYPSIITNGPKYSRDMEDRDMEDREIASFCNNT